MMHSNHNKTVFIVLALLVLGSCCAIVIMQILGSCNTNATLRLIVEQENVIIHEEMLEGQNGIFAHSNRESLQFYGSAGEYTVAVENGKVRMLSSQCTDQLCVNQGWVSDPTTPIICLPQKIVISLEDTTDADIAENGLSSFTQHSLLFDTIVGITVFSADEEEASAALVAAFEELERIDRMATRYGNDTSELSDVQRINAAAGVSPQVVDDDIIIMLKRASELSDLGEGAFNPAIGPLIDLWGISSDGENRVPSQTEVELLLPLVDTEKIHIDEEESTVFLLERGMSLDLGGVAKGYAADRAAEALRLCGIEHALISAGGNVYAIGGRPDGSPWRVGIQDPRGEGEILGVVELVDGSVVTSGDDQRFFIADGTRYHHIINPSNGYPAQGVWQSTIISNSSMDADILSTITFVLGPKKSEALLEQLGVSGVIVDENAGISIFSNDETTITSEHAEGYHLIN